MPYGSNSENSPDPVPNSPPFPQAPITERPRIEPDRVVAYLRSVIKNPEPPPAPEPRLLGFLRRKRRPEADAMPHITPSPAAPARIRRQAAALVSEPAAPAKPIKAEAEPTPEPIQVEEAVLATVATASAEPEACELVEAASAAVSEEIPEALETSSVPLAAAEQTAPVEPEAVAAAVSAFVGPELVPDPAIEPVLEPVPEPVAAAAEPVFEPIPASPAAAPAAAPEASPRPAVMRGEVLPPEAFRSGSAERRRPSEPARVITMQPGIRQDPRETPPPRRA